MATIPEALDIQRVSVLPKSPLGSKNHPLTVLNHCKNVLKRPAHISGPMVRYSKLPFRATVRHFDCDIVYSPMILAREFVRNLMARDSDFTTNKDDTCLIVQVGANNVEDITKVAEMLMPYVDGIGINCGCPIKEQVREGIGAALMQSPDLVADMVRAVKQRCGPEFCVEVKMRIHHDLEETVRWAKTVEAAKPDIITVHGRRKSQRSSEPPNFDAIKLVKDTITSIPVVANGDCFSMEDCNRIAQITGCDGVMSARGILSNPAIFGGYGSTPWSAIELFWDYVTSYGLPFRLTQHHFSEMMEKELSRKERRSMNECTQLVHLIDWFDKRFALKRKGEPGFATESEWPWKATRESFLIEEGLIELTDNIKATLNLSNSNIADSD
ncbi:tRNA-dihydrouridine synthase [Nadsonia fulvescens var. elongata DSM 6958]|uniref:tRNA-dihydrouridine(20a/20b) synthase [NAD(P)+] n=1 Tax=Nadsonia fulvescens var. elongata DSM 6958 TaxID=857566 RepID=A0A1E3PIM8_9ASCO|nr:tRNA-dihydrouridine synthase [Nadsonia fulvescens var. elongata DSM 6958]